MEREGVRKGGEGGGNPQRRMRSICPGELTTTSRGFTGAGRTGRAWRTEMVEGSGKKSCWCVH